MFSGAFQQPQQLQHSMQQPFAQPYQPQPQLQQPWGMSGAGYSSAGQPQLPAAAPVPSGGLFDGLMQNNRPTLPSAADKAAPFSPSPSSNESGGLADMFDPFAPVTAPGPSNSIRA
eukprot:gb/GFBE01056593.1/.p1 GENE.gb/GFBE01056593.1/~~gb/GFBE01056593.1/.p1  ORF type:complete len:116 (+),score=20.14 gb/GFBE01056593.1/:1-348(+)